METKNSNFDENIQLENSVYIPTIEMHSIKSIFFDENKTCRFWNCEILTDLFRIIDTKLKVVKNEHWVKFPEQNLFLPCSKKTGKIESILPLIFESIIDLSTLEGIIEARNRFAILSYLLPKQKNGEVGVLDRNGGATFIGVFKFPNGSINPVIIFWESDHGENGAWWFNNYKYEDANSAFWFAFSQKLSERVNSSDIIL
jgi:hypothetical protein